MLATFFIAIKYIIGGFSSLAALFCTFIIVDVACHLIMQAMFHRQEPSIRYDRIDYINLVVISMSLAALGYFVAYKCFF